MIITLNVGFSSGSDGKESAYNAGDPGLIPGFRRSCGGGHGIPLQYSFLKNPQGQRDLLGYSPWGHKELDMTQLTFTALHFKHNIFLNEAKNVKR